jgi:cytochrome c oxidase assembly protein subunit 15
VVKVSEDSNINKVFGRLILVSLAICIGQGAIGYAQYLTDLPELLVGFHLLGATLVWISAWRINLTGRTSEKVAK